MSDFSSIPLLDLLRSVESESRRHGETEVRHPRWGPALEDLFAEPEESMAHVGGFPGEAPGSPGEPDAATRCGSL